MISIRLGRWILVPFREETCTARLMLTLMDGLQERVAGNGAVKPGGVAKAGAFAYAAFLTRSGRDANFTCEIEGVGLSVIRKGEVSGSFW
jgi:hypothetical protein